MKIGTDGCLLGAWTNVNEAERILEIGAGSGVVALMLAQRCAAKIDAVEIDCDAYNQACENFINSPWTDRLTTYHTSIQEYAKTCTKKYDVIVCSPPYFVDSLKTKDRKRLLARHTDSLSYQELCSCAKRLLSETGKLSVVLPVENAEIFSNTALIEGLYACKTLTVQPKKGVTAIRSLMEFSQYKTAITTSQIAILDKDGKQYTEDYKSLTEDYYIIF